MCCKRAANSEISIRKQTFAQCCKITDFPQISANIPLKKHKIFGNLTDVPLLFRIFAAYWVIIPKKEQTNDKQDAE